MRVAAYAARAATSSQRVNSSSNWSTTRIAGSVLRPASHAAKGAAGSSANPCGSVLPPRPLPGRGSRAGRSRARPAPETATWSARTARRTHRHRAPAKAPANCRRLTAARRPDHREQCVPREHTGHRAHQGLTAKEDAGVVLPEGLEASVRARIVGQDRKLVLIEGRQLARQLPANGPVQDVHPVVDPGLA